MRPRGSVQGVVILACVAVTALFGFACTLNDDGDLGIPPWQADDPSGSSEDSSGVAPIEDALLHADRADAREHLTPQGLLAAVPGGLCLLI